MTPQVLDVALTLMEGLACPRSVSVAILLRYEEYQQVAELRAVEVDYIDSESFWAANAASDFLRKNRDLPITLDLEEKAIASFYESERQCYTSNQRLERLSWGSDSGFPHEVHLIFQCARKKILEWLGSVPPDHFRGVFGPGATMSDDAKHASVPDKISSVPSYTSNAVYHLFPWIGTHWASAQMALGNSPQKIRGGTFFTVPKTALSLRGCEKGPSINGFYQRGIGIIMARRLATIGFDLKNGQTVHGQVAREASITSEFATIDLSSASDTVCKYLVKYLLPEKWFDLLNTLRTPLTRVDGKWVYLEKFSSMGNGFTFELETIVFAALCAAVYSLRGYDVRPGSNLFVYGDDIIVHSELSEDILSVLKFAGFTPNKRKTHVDGNFRESCGSDFFNGVRVRPYNLEEDPYEPQHYIAMANGIRRLAYSAEAQKVRWPLLRRAWFRVLDCIPRHIRRLRGPVSLGDLVIHEVDDLSSHDEMLAGLPVGSNVRWRSGIRYIQVYRPIIGFPIRWEGFAPVSQLAAALYFAQNIPGPAFPHKGLGRNLGLRSFETRPTGQRNTGNLSMRDSVQGYKVGWIPLS